MLFLFKYSFFFSGVVSIDVELSSIDINQCDDQDSSLTDSRGKNGNSDRTGSTDSVKLLDFLGTHKCKQSTQVRLNTKMLQIVCLLMIGLAESRAVGGEDLSLIIKSPTSFVPQRASFVNLLAR